MRTLLSYRRLPTPAAIRHNEATGPPRKPPVTDKAITRKRADEVVACLTAGVSQLKTTAHLYTVPLYLGTTCAGMKYRIANSTGVAPQLRLVGGDGSAYTYTSPPAGTFTGVAADDSIVYATGASTCSAPVRFEQWTDAQGVWLLER